ncbi:hypothetical protein B0H14DRAFT_2578533 [Mycena olivaceomarginata]|nr:hypothetical protein B0H14DRAFT_2578533 [Mycena olivaceomarginata]
MLAHNITEDTLIPAKELEYTPIPVGGLAFGATQHPPLLFGCQDLSWSNFTVKSGDDLSRSTFSRLATALDGRLSHLRTVLVCSPTNENREGQRPLYQADAECFSTIFTSYCSARGLHAFRFYVSDGCAFWYNWGQGTEVVSYATCWMELHTDSSALDCSWLDRSLNLQDVQQDKKKVLPRPPALLTSPVERQRERLRTEPCAQGSAKAKNRSQTSVTDTQWDKWVDKLVAAADEKAVNQSGDKDETHNEKGEQEEERERAWDTAVMLCVEGMREPDCCKWFREQRMQEEREARNAQTVDNLPAPDAPLSTHGASSMPALDATSNTASSTASPDTASNAASAMAAVDVAPASNLQRGECFIQLDAILASYHWRCHLGQIYGESPESHWGGLSRTDGEKAVSKPCEHLRHPVPVYISTSGLCDLVLGILNMVRVNRDGLLEYNDKDDEMPPL